MIHRYNIHVNDRKMELLFDLDPENFYSDFALKTMLDRSELPEPEVVNAMARIIKPGDVVVDAGANVGFFSILMSRLAGAKGMVIAIEPDPRNAEKLLKNLDINDCKNVMQHRSPLSNANVQLEFYQHGENGSSGFWPGPVEEVGTVVMKTIRQTMTLTTAIQRYKPKLLKMDIEGAELMAIQGCDYRIPFVISEINQKALEKAGASIEKLRFHMEQLWGYRTWLLDPNGVMPAGLADHYTQKIVTSKPNTNVLFAKEWDVVKAWAEIRL